jgi:hypothetical protein
MIIKFQLFILGVFISLLLFVSTWIYQIFINHYLWIKKHFDVLIADCPRTKLIPIYINEKKINLSNLSFKFSLIHPLLIYIFKKSKKFSGKKIKLDDITFDKLIYFLALEKIFAKNLQESIYSCLLLIYFSFFVYNVIDNLTIVSPGSLVLVSFFPILSIFVNHFLSNLLEQRFVSISTKINPADSLINKYFNEKIKIVKSRYIVLKND